MDLCELPTYDGRSRHPWEVVRARFFRDLLGRGGFYASPRAVLDVGSGDAYVAGVFARSMAPGSAVVCFDPNYTAQQLAAIRANAPASVSFTAERPARRFDALLFLDVLEHIEDDRGVLGDLVRHSLAPGGLVLISVPAWQALYTQHDRRLRHFRRYGRGDLLRLVRSAGLSPLAVGGLFYSLLLPRAADRLAKAAMRAPLDDDDHSSSIAHWRRGALATSLVTGALQVDAGVSRLLAALRFPMPGLSVWCLSRIP